MKLEVDCYSGYAADERPIRFRLDDKQYLVDTVLDRWLEPHCTYFRIRADDGNVYILRRRSSVPSGEWDLISYRRGGPRS
jgi:hypothetical protein